MSDLCAMQAQMFHGRFVLLEAAAGASNQMPTVFLYFSFIYVFSFPENFLTHAIEAAYCCVMLRDQIVPCPSCSSKHHAMKHTNIFCDVI